MAQVRARARAPARGGVPRGGGAPQHGGQLRRPAAGPRRPARARARARAVRARPRRLRALLLPRAARSVSYFIFQIYLTLCAVCAPFCCRGTLIIFYCIFIDRYLILTKVINTTEAFISVPKEIVSI